MEKVVPSELNFSVMMSCSKMSWFWNATRRWGRDREIRCIRAPPQRAFWNIVRKREPMKPKKISLGRHRQACSICAHPECVEIESKFLLWGSPAVIAKDYGLADRATVYRHAHAFGLFDKRQ